MTNDQTPDKRKHDLEERTARFGEAGEPFHFALHSRGDEALVAREVVREREVGTGESDHFEAEARGFGDEPCARRSGFFRGPFHAMVAAH